MNQEIESRKPKPSGDREQLRTNIGHIRVDSREGIGRVEPGAETEKMSGRLQGRRTTTRMWEVEQCLEQLPR